MTLNVDNVVIKLHPSTQISLLILLQDSGRASVLTEGRQFRVNQVYCWINETSSWVFSCFGKSSLSSESRNACGGLSTRMQNLCLHRLTFHFFLPFSQIFSSAAQNLSLQNQFVLFASAQMINFLPHNNRSQSSKSQVVFPQCLS